MNLHIRNIQVQISGFKNWRNAIKLYSAVFLSAFAFGCNDSASGPADSPISGHIRVSVDESFYPLMDAEIDVFHSHYEYAVIEPAYIPEGQALKDLIADSVRLAVVTRELTENEMEYFRSKKLFPETVKIATDAIALITHPENPDTVVTMQQLSDMFAGKLSNWKSLNPTSALDSLLIVFDNKNSSTARYIMEKFQTELPAYCFAVNTNPEVINYVSANKNAIGVIGVNWISDAEDTTAIDFLKKINVMRIISDSADTRGKQPYQAYIAQGKYPLTRSIYMICSEPRKALGSGLTAFVASDKGQRIVLKAGLVPATMPVRIIGFK